MATSLEISEKEVQIDHLHPRHFHLVKRLLKSVQRILRLLFSDRSLKNFLKNINASKFVEQAKLEMCGKV